MARRSRDKIVIFLTLEWPPRGRPLWLCRRHSSQRRDSTEAASRPLSRPTFADRPLSRPTCVAWVRLITACKLVGVVRMWWRVSPARPTRSFQNFSGGHGAATDRLHVGRGHAWALVGLHPRPVVGNQGPCAGGHADAVLPHSLTRRRTAGGIGWVAGTRLVSVRTEAGVMGRLFLRANAPPAIPPTPSSHPAPPTPPSHLPRPPLPSY